MSDSRNTEAAGRNAADLKTVADAARQLGDNAVQAGSDAVQQAKAVAGDAQKRAASLLDDVTEKASSTAEAQKQNVAGYLDDVAKAVHRSGGQLEGHQDWVAHMVERGAAELSVLANTLRANDMQSLMGELGSLARRQPALFVGASMAAGFALVRVGRLAATGATPSPSQPAASTFQPLANQPPATQPNVQQSPASGEPALPTARLYPGDRP